MTQDFHHPFRDRPMSELSLDAQEPGTPAIPAVTPRKPFVPPSVEALGGLNHLTLLGGSI